MLENKRIVEFYFLPFFRTYYLDMHNNQERINFDEQTYQQWEDSHQTMQHKELLHQHLYDKNQRDTKWVHLAYKLVMEKMDHCDSFLVYLL